MAVHQHPPDLRAGRLRLSIHSAVSPEFSAKLPWAFTRASENIIHAWQLFSKRPEPHIMSITHHAQRYVRLGDESRRGDAPIAESHAPPMGQREFSALVGAP